MRGTTPCPSCSADPAVVQPVGLEELDVGRPRDRVERPRQSDRSAPLGSLVKTPSRLADEHLEPLSPPVPSRPGLGCTEAREPASTTEGPRSRWWRSSW
jgi:hypothetical protein